jgi:SAM-dependent methyltransferase
MNAGEASNVDPLDPIDTDTPEFIDLYDELPVWSAPFGPWILDRCPLGTDLTILDLGAGTGFLTIELAERCGPTGNVIAVDPWEAAMLRLRRKVAQRRLMTNVRLLAQDAATIDLAACSVDVIVSTLGVNNFDDPAAVLRVCSRLAKPGATFILTTNVVGHMAGFYEPRLPAGVEADRPGQCGPGDLCRTRGCVECAGVEARRTLLDDSRRGLPGPPSVVPSPSGRSSHRMTNDPLAFGQAATQVSSSLFTPPRHRHVLAHLRQRVRLRSGTSFLQPRHGSSRGRTAMVR